MCYGDLGCFSTGGVFTDLHRFVNLDPESPADINTQFYLYTRNDSTTDNNNRLDPNDTASLEYSSFDSDKATKMIVHGFRDNGFNDWVMVGIKREDTNVEPYNILFN